jgi:hypothetical protein
MLRSVDIDASCAFALESLAQGARGMPIPKRVRIRGAVDDLVANQRKESEGIEAAGGFGALDHLEGLSRYTDLTNNQIDKFLQSQDELGYSGYSQYIECLKYWSVR